MSKYIYHKFEADEPPYLDPFLDLKLLVYTAFNKMWPKGMWLGGGACGDNLIGEPISKTKDFDFFFETPEDLENVCRFAEGEYHFKLTHTSESARTFLFSIDTQMVYKLQFINKLFGAPEEIINSFDFIHCQFLMNDVGYYEGKDSKDCRRFKRLRINKISEPVSSVQRMAKFLARGYTIDSRNSDRLLGVLKDKAVAAVFGERFARTQWFIDVEINQTPQHDMKRCKKLCHDLGITAKYRLYADNFDSYTMAGRPIYFQINFNSEEEMSLFKLQASVMFNDLTLL